MGRRGKIARMGDGRLIDLSTTNKSFRQVARDLKFLGIKNYYFMLEINDISLTEINPHKCDADGHTTLSKDQITRVLNECAVNPWYFLREVVRIMDQGGTSVPYKANRGNIAQAWCMYNGIDSWLCLPRQQGKTVSALAFQLWVFLFGTSNSKFIFVNKDGDNAKNNLRILMDMLYMLPEYMRSRSIVDAEGKRIKAKENATEATNPTNNNTIITKPKATSRDSAISLARGLSAPCLHFDEPEFTNYVDLIIQNSVSTYDTAAANARANGAQYFRCFTCTPGDLDSGPGQASEKLLDKTVKWSEKFYDRGPQYIETMISNLGEDCNGIIYIEYQYYQIGKTEKWLQHISAKINDKLTVRREILLQRLHGSSLSPYDREDIEYIVSVEQKPIDELWVMDFYKFDIYKKLDPSIPYIVGVDCSTGTLGDNNAITVINPYTLHPDAEFESSFIGETKYEHLLIELVLKHIPRAVLCIERNSIGDGIIDHLLYSPISTRLYFDKSLDLMGEMNKEHSTVESMLKKNAEKKTYYGVYTTGRSREDMFKILSDRVYANKDDFVTHNVIRDISRLVKTKSGKIVAGEGFHDDSIMSYLIGMYVYVYGNNLSVFGITKGHEPDFKENQGMRRPEEIDPSLVDPRLIEEAKANAAKERAADEWNMLYKQAIERAQQNSYKLAKAGLTENVYTHTVESEVYDTGFSEDDMAFFNEINGINKADIDNSQSLYKTSEPNPYLPNNLVNPYHRPW